MGQKQSKDELLYHQVNSGNTQGIKALQSEGAGLEWTDSKGNTPLILACMNLELYNVAKTLIELGANVNAYSPGRQAGTPLHHAAKGGLEQTAKLLLSHGANAVVMNDDYQTPLDIARAKGYSTVVRAIEENVCLFSGWLRELHGPGLLEVLAPKLLSRKVRWVVVLPCGSRNPRKPFRLEIAIYAGLQEGHPRMIIPLWKAKLEEPNFHQPDPAAIISDVSRMPKRWRKRRAIKSSQEARSSRIKLAPAHASDKEQLKLFCDACKGIPQVKHPVTTPSNDQPSMAAESVPPTTEDEELTMAINASLQSSQERPFPADSYSFNSNQKESTSFANSTNQEPSWIKFDVPEANSTGYPPQFKQNQNSHPPAAQPTYENHSPVYAPSAPPVASAPIYDGPIHYPPIDTSYFDSYSPNVEAISAGGNKKKEESGASFCCPICLDAQVEGACVPCGHMAGCMSCLNDIKSKNWGCPLCRTKIVQVMRIYAV